MSFLFFTSFIDYWSWKGKVLVVLSTCQITHSSPIFELFSKPWFFGFIFGCCAAVGFSWFALVYFSEKFVIIVQVCCNVLAVWYWRICRWLHDTDSSRAYNRLEPGCPPVLHCCLLGENIELFHKHSISMNYYIEVKVAKLVMIQKQGLFDGPRWSPLAGIVVMSSTMIGCYSFMLYAAAAIVRSGER